MRILGIETSCDETAVCIIEVKESDKGEVLTILGNQLYSQVAKHKEFGGVFPMLAKREHAKNLVPLLDKCLQESGLKTLLPSLDKEGLGAVEKKVREILTRENDLAEQLLKLLATNEKPDIDAIAVTNGPGLEPALWVGVTFAQALNIAWNIPIYATNHMEGHIVVAYLLPSLDKEGLGAVEKSYKLQTITYPSIALLISGGHTQLVLIKEHLDYKIIGNTRDDASGEAFDKAARILGLPYPGGPEISKLTIKERKENPNKKTNYPLPRPMINSNDLDFSFSGLKTALLYTVKKIPELTPEIKQELAKEFEEAVIEVLIAKTKQAVLQHGAKNIIIGGGVSASQEIRNRFKILAAELQIGLYIPEISASTDNALMIALAGYLNVKNGKKPSLDFIAKGNLTLGL